MTDLAPFRMLAERDHGLCVVVTRRPDLTPHASVVNAGVIAHPGTGHDAVAFVVGGDARKLVHLRRDPTITVVARAGWEWAAVDGDGEVIGPDDPHEAVGADALRMLLRDVFVAAGGSHDDWDEYDRVMRDERRAAVFVTPRRTSGVVR